MQNWTLSSVQGPGWRESRLPTSRRRGKINPSTKFLFLVCLHNTPMLIRKLVKFYCAIATGNTCKIAYAHSPHVVRPGIRHGHSDSNTYLCPAYSMQSLVLMIFIWTVHINLYLCISTVIHQFKLFGDYIDPLLVQMH